MYKLNRNGGNSPVSVRMTNEQGELVHIPFDPDNTDYQAFLKYKAEGGKVYGADEEIPNGQTS